MTDHVAYPGCYCADCVEGNKHPDAKLGATSLIAHMTASSMCPICGTTNPHNHSLFEVEAYHRCWEAEERNYGLVTFRTEEVRKMIRTRALGMNDRAEKHGFSC